MKKYFFFLILLFLKHKKLFDIKKSSEKFTEDSYYVIPERFERSTHALEGRCSIQLSYGTILICAAKVMFFLIYTKTTIVFLLERISDSKMPRKIIFKIRFGNCPSVSSTFLRIICFHSRIKTNKEKIKIQT